MKEKVTLADRLLKRLKALGVGDRKAKALVKDLAPTAARQKVSGTVTEKLTVKLVKLGLSERKAKELAKGLAPTVRTAIKAKAKTAKKKLDDVTDEDVNAEVDGVVDLAEDIELDKVAPRVNGHRVRLDLPVVLRSTWQSKPVKGIELLRVMDGLSTTATYLVAAVKSDEGIVAVRQLGSDFYNVKFYPHMGYWGKTQEELASLGAQEYLAREWYQRMHMNRATLEQVLFRLEAEAKPRSRMKALLDRMMSVTAAPLIKAFDYLHKRVGVAA
jgi:hypothetical protein